MIRTAWPVVLELQPIMHLERIDGRTVAAMAVLLACRPPGPLVTEWEFGGLPPIMLPGGRKLALTISVYGGKADLAARARPRPEMTQSGRKWCKNLHTMRP
jgi:hypothetical protein